MHRLLTLLVFLASARGQTFGQISPLFIESMIRQYAMEPFNLNSSVVPNAKCRRHGQMFFDGLSPMNPKKWAVQMFDATGKILPGILKGSIAAMLGDYNQCLEIYDKQDNIHGQYCLISVSLNPVDPGMSAAIPPLPGQLTPQKLQSFLHHTLAEFVQTQMKTLRKVNDDEPAPFTFGMCIPSSCSSQDLQAHINSLESRYGSRYHIPTNLTRVQVRKRDCQTMESRNVPFGWSEWAMIILLGGVLVVALISTWIDNKYGKSRYGPASVACSLKTNMRTLLKTRSDASDITCLHGIRLISIVWIIYGHRFMHNWLLHPANIADFMAWRSSLIQIISMNASLPVDSFLLMSGLLFVYGVCKKRKNGAKFNVIALQIHRYVRLTPVLFVTVLFIMTLWPHMGTGPLWPQSQLEQTRCRTNWWRVLLYIQNYNVAEKMCLPYTWYLSLDSQMFLIASVVMGIFFKNQKLAWGVIGAAMLASTLETARVVYKLNLTGHYFADMIRADVFEEVYITVQMRAVSYFIGMILGYVLFKFTNVKIPKTYAIVGWSMQVIVFFSLLYSQYAIAQKQYDTNRVIAAVYYSFYRVVWCVQLSWVIFASHNKRGGVVNWFLSLPVFKVFSRLTYCIYIVHYPVQLYHVFIQKYTSYVSMSGNVYNTAGDFIVSTVLATILYMLFELPISNLQAILLAPPKKEIPSVVKNEGLDETKDEK